MPRPKQCVVVSGSCRQKVLSSAKSLYERDCASCHGRDLLGSPPEFPALTDMSRKYNEAEMRSLICDGVGRMPGFPALSGEATLAVARYLLTGEDVRIAPEKAGPATLELKYTIDGYNRFLDRDGYPAVEPPWGTLNAIDLNKGEIVWQIPLTRAS